MRQKNSIAEVLKDAIYKDKNFFYYIAVYSIIVSLVDLSMPISIQLLINSIANTALIQPILIIGIVLSFLLGFSAILSLMQKHLLEIYKQNSFVRLSSRLFAKSIDSEYNEFNKTNTSYLSSHYFDIFNIQNSASILVMEGFIALLQILICFTISSLYHPYFMVMNILALIVIWLSWVLFKNKAIKLSIQRSESKYRVFGWLQDVFRLNSTFRSKISKNYAINKSFTLIDDYVDKRKQAWTISFTQLSILTILYVILNIALFVVGSILVIKGQLSLGQLIAAEILYSVTLFSSAKLSNYFDIYYGLIASADELDHVLSLPTEKIKNSNITIDDKVENILALNNVSYTSNVSSTNYKFDFRIKQSSTNLIISNNEEQKDILIELISYLISPNIGQIKFYNYEYSDFNPQELRNHICVIDSTDIFSCSVPEYLAHGYNNVSDTEMNYVLELAGMKSLVQNLPHGIQANLIGNGFPLYGNQIVQLKLARAMLHKPRVLIINDVFYKVPEIIQLAILKYITQNTQITLIHISYPTNQVNLQYHHVIDLDKLSIK